MTLHPADVDPVLLPTWIAAIAAAVGVLVAIGAVGATLVQIRATAKQVARDSEDRTRPYLGIDIVPGLQGPPMFDIVIANSGQTPARNIRLELEGGGFGPLTEGDVIGPALGRIFRTPFEIGPSGRRRLIWHGLADKNAEPSGAVGAPAVGRVKITYEWQPGEGEDIRRYEDHIAYDLTEYPMLIPAPSSGAEAEGHGADVVVRNAVHALRQIAANVADLGR